jgi:hypothetical protein
MGANSLLRSLRLLMLIPFLGAMGYGLLMTKFADEMTKGEPGLASNIVLKFGAAWLDHKAGKTRDAVIDTASLNADRVVSLQRKLSITDLPGGADGTLSGPRAEIAALAFARQWAEPECEAMIKTFATACSFSTAQVTISDNGDVRLNVDLSFSSPTPVGDTSGIEQASLIPQRVELTDRKGIDVPADDIAAERARIYAAAETACATLRAEKGNCVISQISFEQQPTEGGLVTIFARGIIASLGQTVSASELVDIGLDLAAENSGDSAAFAPALVAIATKAAELDPEEGALPSGLSTGTNSLFDRADQPRLKDSQGGAKFVTAP